MKRNKMWAAVALPLLVGSATLTAAPSAGAATTGTAACTHPSWRDVDTGTGYLLNRDGSAPLRSGPNAECSVNITVFSGRLSYDCYVVNSAGNTWTHAKYDDTGTRGWIYDGNLNDGGAQTPC
ncbi:MULTISPECIES: SH3 domain-containing protein [unclassified Streptomyces]|uniref:SH3 domain-containing protein n=1 Tax=unclassified Streptomyces TaxID=2593676 RepID=UPI00336A2DB2